MFKLAASDSLPEAEAELHLPSNALSTTTTYQSRLPQMLLDIL
jgi:hypothetical protein